MKIISRILTVMLAFYLAAGGFFFVMTNGDNAANWIFVYGFWTSPTLPWIDHLDFVKQSPVSWRVFHLLALLANGLVPYLAAQGLLRLARKKARPAQGVVERGN